MTAEEHRAYAAEQRELAQTYRSIAREHRIMGWLFLAQAICGFVTAYLLWPE